MLTINEQKMRSVYDQFLEYATKHAEEIDLLKQVKSWQEGIWKEHFVSTLKPIPLSLEDKAVIDFGCKYGLLFPLLLELGAKKVIGIENLDRFIAPARDLFKSYGERVEIISSEEGFIPLQPASVDLIIVDEVISHISPMYLPMVYSEFGRILKPGGMLFISDGNNLGYLPYVKDTLLPLYDALENGPDGTDVGDVHVYSCLSNQRKRYIEKRYPQLTGEQVEYVGQNTFRLYGKYLEGFVNQYVETGEIIRRPYQHGLSPAYPDKGQVEERGFYSEQVMYDLMEYGFICKDLPEQINGVFFHIPGKIIGFFPKILKKPVAAFLSTTVMKKLLSAFLNKMADIICWFASKLDMGNVRGSITLSGRDFTKVDAYSNNLYSVPFPQDVPEKANVVLLEDEHELIWYPDDLEELAREDDGRYDVWPSNGWGRIFFSPANNSDPRTNGKKYKLLWQNRARIPAANSKFQVVAVKVK